MDGKKPQRSSKKANSDKIHLEIAPGNWRRMEEYLAEYNASPLRLTPKLKVADVVNAALLDFLAAHGDGVERG